MMLVQPTVTSFPWVTISWEVWGGDPLWSHNCQGGPVSQKRKRMVTFSSSPNGRAFQGSDKPLNRRKTPKGQSFFPLDFSEVSSALIPVDSLWAMSVQCLLRGSRGAGGTVGPAASQMKPLAPKGLSSRPCFPPALQLCTLVSTGLHTRRKDTQ